MILVNVRKSAENAATPAQVLEAAAGDWIISEETLDSHGDVLLAVRRNRVLGAYDILGWERVDDRAVRFELRESEQYAHLVGEEAPATWRRGQANPVLVVETANMGTATIAGAAARSAGSAGRKPRRGVHRVVIETRGLSDDEAARLHHTLITMALSTGAVHDYRTTSLVREMKAAADELAVDYHSRTSPKKQWD